MRDPASHLYAYAIPDPRAIKLIANEGDVCEVGAGTGYWAHLLRESGVDVTAYDSHAGDNTLRMSGDWGHQEIRTREVGNEYHGEVPSFTQVKTPDPNPNPNA